MRNSLLKILLKGITFTVTGVFLLFISLASAQASDCEKSFAKVAVEYAKKPFVWLKNQQRNYWHEVYEWDAKDKSAYDRTHLSRLFLAPRPDPEKFHWLWAFDDPVSESSVLLKKFGKKPFERRLSIPASMVTWGIINDQKDEWMRSKTAEEVLANKEKHLGAEYLFSLAEKKVLDRKDLKFEIEKHNRILTKWLTSETFEHPRIKEFLAEKILKNNIEAKEFEKLARKVLNEVAEIEPIEKENTKFASILRERFASALVSHEIFGRKSKRDQSLLQLFWLPQIKFGGFFEKNFTDLQAAKEVFDSDLHNLIGDIGMVSAMKIAAEKSLRDPVAIERKKKKAMGLSQEIRFVANRPDIPKYVSEKRDELDRWFLISTDPRFQFIYDSFKKKELSEVEALFKLDQKESAYNELYEMQKAEVVPSVASICKLTGLSADGQNVPNLNFLEVAQLSAGLDACRYRMGVAVWNYYREEMKMPAEKRQELRANLVQTINLIADNCPREKGQFACP